MADVRAAAAREHHRAAAALGVEATEHRRARDDLIRTLYREGGWSYSALAAAVGCSPELVALIMREAR